MKLTGELNARVFPATTGYETPAVLSGRTISSRCALFGGGFEKLDRSVYVIGPPIYVYAIVSGHTKRCCTPAGLLDRQVRPLRKQEFHDGDTGVAARINERILEHVIGLKRRTVETEPLRARCHGHLLAASRDVTPNEMQISRGRGEDEVVNRSAARNKSLRGGHSRR